MKFFLKILYFGNILLAICTLFAYLSPYVNPSGIYFFSFFGVLFPWLFLLNVFAVVFWAFAQKKRALLSFFILVLGFSSIRNNISFHLPSKIENTVSNISIASYNCHHASYTLSNGKIDIGKEEAFLEFISSFNNNDIFCVQENSGYSQRLLKKALHFKNVYSIDEKKNIIYSKYKILQGGNIDFGTYTNSCIWVDLFTGVDTIRVYSIHLQSNKVSQEAEIIVDGNFEQKKTWDGTKSMMKRYKIYASTRTQQIKKIIAHKASSPYPVVIAGDMNDVPQSYVYKTLSKGMKDSFVEQGFGIDATYAGVIPALRIDYILTNPAFKILSHKVINKEFSDHYPIQSFIELK